jgi:hypothetical protein
MADVIHIANGFSPWKPSADAELVKQYQYYEFPLKGIIRQHGVRYYFACIGGVQSEVTVWLYVRVSPAEESALDNSTRETFGVAVHPSGPAVVALALEGTGIIASQLVDDVSPESVQQAFLYLQEAFESWANTAREVQLTYAT